MSSRPSAINGLMGLTDSLFFSVLLEQNAQCQCEPSIAKLVGRALCRPLYCRIHAGRSGRHCRGSADFPAFAIADRNRGGGFERR